MKTSHLLLVFTASVTLVEGGFNRCFVCRSRGDLGSCKDPFIFTNASALPEEHRVQTQPCTSGWCGKILDRGANSFKDEEYGAATERLCMQRGPNDNEERCAQTIWGHTKVYMCMCQGDLCNGSAYISPSLLLLLATTFLGIFIRL
ncbi:hypothetical protein GE061_005927 [Apolygus lucorum]|uniref:Uncharacterized protein n=1 Tax=Apolygus lucorum TaxID=248454 RepID=A0A6A4J930_APOLU|nr:hypothetical protein GE061_005927 [Apolygus lucorum]